MKFVRARRLRINSKIGRRHKISPNDIMLLVKV